MKYIIKKITTLIITLFIVSLLAFLAFQIIPGDPTTSLLGTNATPEAVAELRAQLGLDRPVIVRYADWLLGFLRGDMGMSYNYSMPVGEMIAGKLPITLILTLMSFLITVGVSIPLGIYAARKENRLVDRVITVTDQIVMSVPPFFIGIVCCWVFGIIFKVFTPGNFVSYTRDPVGFFVYMIFPALSIAIPRIAMTVKMLRTSILEQMGQDYVRTAYSRGHSRDSAMNEHVLRNAIIPVITFIAVSVAEMVAGSIIIEQVFSVPGIGRLLLASISNRDFPVAQAIVVILALWVVAVNFVADILYQYVDPRIRLN